MDIQTLETWLWDAACVIRGPVDAPKFKDYILPLPENLFYNATAPGVIIVINRKKRHPGEILLINASQQFAKDRPRNYLAEEHIETIAALYHDWEAWESLSTIITKEEAEEERAEAERAPREMLLQLGFKLESKL